MWEFGTPGKQILLLLAVLPLSLLLLGAGWQADSVAICDVSALFAALGRRLERRYFVTFCGASTFLVVLGRRLQSRFRRYWQKFLLRMILENPRPLCGHGAKVQF